MFFSWVMGTWVFVLLFLLTYIHIYTSCTPFVDISHQRFPKGTEVYSTLLFGWYIYWFMYRKLFLDRYIWNVNYPWGRILRSWYEEDLLLIVYTLMSFNKNYMHIQFSYFNIKFTPTYYFILPSKIIHILP